MTQTTRRTALVAFAAAAAAAPVLLNARLAFAQDANEYKAQTLAVGSVALQTSQIALEKGSDAMVKEFAQLEVAEQTTVAEILTGAGGAPAPLTPEQQAMIDDLNAMEPGPAFDRAYIEGQITGHQQLLEIQQTMSGVDDMSVEAITAKLAEQAITSHLVMLGHLRDMLPAA